MKKTLLKFVLFSALIAGILIPFNSCEEVLNELDASIESLGLFLVSTDTTNIESDISFASSGSLPGQVDLRQKFPPIGNQGAYGTCVSWAVGYNLKTFLEGAENDWSQGELQNPSNQSSPKDLFWAIDNSDKGSNCGGTSFEAAFDVLVSRGVATMYSVPYDNLNDCSEAPSASWTSEANGHKIDNYRRINLTEEEVKNYLAQGRPVVIGAQLGDGFMSWNSSSSISYDTYLEPGMQHAYHAMIVAGYDDSKSAFLVVNSWGSSWGSSGYIWVDYSFFISDFCYAAYVATNQRTDPDGDDDNEVDDPYSDTDLLAWDIIDSDNYSQDDARYRSIQYSVFNSGNSTIEASSDWNIIYTYYNAYDANDYGVLLYDYYSNDYGYYGDVDWSWNGGDGISASAWNYFDVPSGMSVSEVVDASSQYFTWGYYLQQADGSPLSNGSYYFVLIADGYNTISEYDESNNYNYFAQSNGNPIYVENGEISSYNTITKGANQMKTQRPQQFSASDFPTVRNSNNTNAYDANEIIELLKHHQESGELARRANIFINKRKEEKSIPYKN